MAVCRAVWSFVLTTCGTAIADEWAAAENEIRSAFVAARPSADDHGRDARRLQSSAGPSSAGPSTGPGDLAPGSGIGWFLVDTTSVVCTGLYDVDAPGIAVINISLAELSANSSRSPHIITFYRTSGASVSVNFFVDAPGFDPARNAEVTSGRIVVPNQVVLEAPDEDARRLDSDALDSNALDEGPGSFWAAGGVSEEPGDNWFEEPWAEARKAGSSMMDGRALRSGGRSSGRSGGRSSRTSARARPSPAPPAYARRRGAPASSAVRRRATGVGGGASEGRFSNAHSPAGSYGYTGQARMQSNFGGATPRPSGYGYSGHNAYRADSMQGVRIRAAGAGAAAFMFARPRYHGSGSRCRTEERTEECTEYCACERPLGEDATRDDLMMTGFIPEDYGDIVSVTITNIAGADFGQDRICPPAGWDVEAGRRLDGVEWTPPERQDLFVTLTMMDELADSTDDLAVAAAYEQHLSTVVLLLATGLALALWDDPP